MLAGSEWKYVRLLLCTLHLNEVLWHGAAGCIPPHTATAYTSPCPVSGAAHGAVLPIFIFTPRSPPLSSGPAAPATSVRWAEFYFSIELFPPQLTADTSTGLRARGGEMSGQQRGGRGQWPRSDNTGTVSIFGHCHSPPTVWLARWLPQLTPRIFSPLPSQPSLGPCRCQQRGSAGQRTAARARRVRGRIFADTWHVRPRVGARAGAGHEYDGWMWAAVSRAGVTWPAPLLCNGGGFWRTE